jgi:hypothetical protein
VFGLFDLVSRLAQQVGAQVSQQFIVVDDEDSSHDTPPALVNDR